jgi:hypothetical protein
MKRRWGLIVIVILLIPVAVHAVWDQVESTRLARDIARLKQQGEPVDATATSWLASAEQRRSARLYAAAAGLARSQTQGDGFSMTAKDVELPGSDPRLEEARLQAYLAEAEPALQLAALAASLDFAGFSSIDPQLQTNQSGLETLSGMSNLKADILSVGGEASLASDELVRAAILQRTITIPYYRYGSVGRLYGSLRILLKHASPDAGSLRRLQAALETWPDDDGVVADLRRERALRLGVFWPYPTDGVSWARRPQQGYRASIGEAIGFVASRPLLTHALRSGLQPYAEAIAVAGEPWPAKLDSTRALAKRYGVEPGVASNTSLFNAFRHSGSFGVQKLTLTLPVAGMNLAFRRTAIAVLAAERFRRAHAGQPPPSLEALVPEFLASVPQDPFDGQPLKYRVAADSYVVYSVDINRVDDNGAIHGFGTGIGGRIRPIRDDPSPRDIGIRVPLRVQ